jgi:hypothetical protein
MEAVETYQQKENSKVNGRWIFSYIEIHKDNKEANSDYGKKWKHFLLVYKVKLAYNLDFF